MGMGTPDIFHNLRRLSAVTQLVSCSPPYLVASFGVSTGMGGERYSSVTLPAFFVDASPIVSGETHR